LARLTIRTQIEHEERASLPVKGGASAEQLSSVDESIMRISGHVSVLTRQQKYFRTRENRNFSTVKSTENRIFKLSLMESGMMVAMAGLQVLVVRWFFTGGRKGLLENCCRIEDRMLMILSQVTFERLCRAQVTTKYDFLTPTAVYLSVDVFNANPCFW
jgi:hypothetical protein